MSESTKLFYYRQNNSFGFYTIVGTTKSRKNAHNLAIFAASEDAANEIAKTYGVYFNGVDDGIDCPCCGNRWSKPNIYDIMSVEDIHYRSIRYEHNTLIVTAY